MSKLSTSILDKIKQEHVKPKPKWWFVLMHTSMWTAIVISILVGSIAMGVLLHEFSGAEWEHIGRLDHDGVPGFVLMLPYVWFVMLGLTLLLSYHLFAHTKKGYKHQPYAVVAATALISVLLGVGMYITRTAERFEEVMIERIPPYAQYMKIREGLLVSPEHGIVAGIILDKEEGVLIILNDVMNRQWKVDIRNARYREAVVDVGRVVLALGEVDGAHDFTATDIKPFHPRIPMDFYRPAEKNERNSERDM